MSLSLKEDVKKAVLGTGNEAVWIEAKSGFNIHCNDNYKCSNCRNTEKLATFYCSYCGKRMVNKEPIYWKPYYG